MNNKEKPIMYNKIANKQKLLDLLFSGDKSYFEQALLLNETFNLLTQQEIDDASYLLNGLDKKEWVQGGKNWYLLQTYPNFHIWKTITELDLEGNNLSSLPSEIGNLTNLKHLLLASNKLTSLPKEIGNLRNLKFLALTRNKLSTLPSSIGNLKNLEFLEVSVNKLTSLPKEIGNLTNLQDLYIGYNKLTSLPSSIGNLTKLENLGLWQNNLTLEEVPSNLHKVTRI